MNKKTFKNSRTEKKNSLDRLKNNNKITGLEDRAIETIQSFFFFF